MITGDQLVAHAIGDYIIQSDWMATEKARRSLAALVHALTYALPFLLLTTSPAALAVIVGTHFVIDRWRLARFVVFAKNFLGPPSQQKLVPPGRLIPVYPSWDECSGTGYHKSRPEWLAVWLLIIADNVLHVLINGAALRWL